jgi:DNA-binding transcriptional LysR family regulator
MVRRFYNLPSLTSLAAFEASARHGSFKRAAAELNVTPGAISRQIKSLETELGVDVFVRTQNGIVLSPEAEELYAVVSSAFSRTSEAVQRIKSKDSEARVTLACTHAFATMWLMPRMGSFWRRYPHIIINHLVSDNVRDFRRSEVDLRVRYGSGAWPDETSHRLMNETMYPVSSPSFAKRHGNICPKDIPSLPLLEVGWADPAWTDWDELLRRAGVSHGAVTGRRLSNFALALQACQEDQGLAIGWHKLIKGLIAQKKLVAFGDIRMAAPGGYYLCWNCNRSLSSAAEIVKSWLIEMAEEDQD